MFKKITLYFLIFSLGIFLIPIKISSCNSNEISVCCKNNDVKKMSDCCSNGKTKNEKQDKDCDGKCNYSSCQCLSFQISIVLPVFFKIIEEQISFKSRKEQFFIRETNTSNGFCSTWLLPKIS
jgi:hypothetical protein